MECTHHQMAGFGSGQRYFDGFEIAHFADQNHVGVLAQSRSQGVGKAVGVNANFALVHDRTTIANQEFDGVLDRHDV